MAYPKKLNKKQLENYKLYKIPSCGVHQKCPVVDSHKGWRFSKGNTIEHERKKFEIAFEIWKNGGVCQMETERVGSKPRRIIDVLELLPNGEIIEWEIESTLKGAMDKMKDLNVKIVPVDWSDKTVAKFAKAKEEKRQRGVHRAHVYAHI